MKMTTLENELTTALFRLSFGKLSIKEARNKATHLAKNINLNDDIVAHKGVNWYAKEVLKKCRNEINHQCQTGDLFFCSITFTG